MMGESLFIKTNEKVNKKPVYRIEGDYSINNIERIKEELKKILENDKKIHLDIKNIENIDLTAIQLLYSLKKYLKEDFSFGIELKEDQKQILLNSGFGKFFNLK